MSKRAQMSEVRREAVLRATAELLDEVGVAALTVRQVADRAGVAQGSIFLYAQNKTDLVNQVFGLRIAQGWHALLDELADLPPLARVEAFYLACVDIFYADLENVQAFYSAMASHTGTRLETIDQLRARVREVLEEAALAGELRARIDLDVLDYSYQGLYSNVIRLADAGISHPEARRIIGESMIQLRDGVCATG